MVLIHVWHSCCLPLRSFNNGVSRYGSHFFYSLKVQCVPDLLSDLPNNLLLAFNADGMHIFSVDKKELLQQYSYADVHSWRGTRRQVSQASQGVLQGRWLCARVRLELLWSIQHQYAQRNVTVNVIGAVFESFDAG